MGSGRRCGCWALSELDLERSRHRNAVEENLRYERKIQDLQDELSILHGTIADLEKRFTDLSSRHRKSMISLDDATNSTERFKDYSSDMSNENRKLKLNCERLQKEVKCLRDAVDCAKDEASDEVRRRIAIETDLGRDLEDTESNYVEELRRTSSMHDLDSHHLKQDITRLQSALRKEKEYHDVTKRTFGHPALHRPPSYYNYPYYHDWPYWYLP